MEWKCHVRKKQLWKQHLRKRQRQPSEEDDEEEKDLEESIVSFLPKKNWNFVS